MRVGEQSRFAEHAKLFVSAPQPSSAPFGGTCPYPLCPFGTFPPDRGNRPRGEGMGCIPSARAFKIHNCPPAGGASPSPTLRRNNDSLLENGRGLPLPFVHFMRKNQAPARGKTVHPSPNTHSTRYPYSQLGNGCLAAHKVGCLVLLGSPPDTVHRSSLRKTGSSTPLIWVRRYRTYPRSGIGPRCSGLRVTGHRYLPGWYSLAMSRSPWGFKFSRACSLRNRPARRWWRPFLPSPDRRPALPPDP